MPSKSLGKGICPSCVHTRRCDYRLSFRRPIYDCDEYYSYTPPGLWERNGNPRAVTDTPAVAVSKSNHPPGLCRTCYYVDDCTLAPAEGGVWHCAQYE